MLHLRVSKSDPTFSFMFVGVFGSTTLRHGIFTWYLGGFLCNCIYSVAPLGYVIYCYSRLFYISIVITFSEVNGFDFGWWDYKYFTWLKHLIKSSIYNLWSLSFPIFFTFGNLLNLIFTTKDSNCRDVPNIQGRIFHLFRK